MVGSISAGLAHAIGQRSQRGRREANPRPTFGSVGSAAGACLAFLDAFNVVLDELVRVVVPLAFGCVLVAATMRARVSRLMIHL